MANYLAPILLFTYKRLATLKVTVSALQQNGLASASELFIFSDAAKFDKDRAIVDEVRGYLKTITGFKKITIYEAPTNKGLANSIIDGVTKIIDEYEKVIVLEDDLNTTPNFLSFMNNSLDTYQTSGKVFSVSGYSFNLGKSTEPEFGDAYFLNRGWSWGWATWKNRWEQVDWEVKNYAAFSKNKQLRKQFAKGGSDLNKMLDSQMSGKLDSWAIRWFFHQFQNKGLTLYPVFSKVYNEGFDRDATHTTGSSNRYLPSLDTEHKLTFQLPAAAITPFYQQKFQDKMGIVSRLVSKWQTLLKKIAQ